MDIFKSFRFSCAYSAAFRFSFSIMLFNCSTVTPLSEINSAIAVSSEDFNSSSNFFLSAFKPFSVSLS